MCTFALEDRTRLRAPPIFKSKGAHKVHGHRISMAQTSPRCVSTWSTSRRLVAHRCSPLFGGSFPSLLNMNIKVHDEKDPPKSEVSDREGDDSEDMSLFPNTVPEVVSEMDDAAYISLRIYTRELSVKVKAAVALQKSVGWACPICNYNCCKRLRGKPSPPHVVKGSLEERWIEFIEWKFSRGKVSDCDSMCGTL